MGRYSDYKKHSEFAALDMDKGCRNIVNQHSPGKRRLRKRLMRQARARMKWDGVKVVTAEWLEGRMDIYGKPFVD